MYIYVVYESRLYQHDYIILRTGILSFCLSNFDIEKYHVDFLSRTYLILNVICLCCGDGMRKNDYYVIFSGRSQ